MILGMNQLPVFLPARGHFSASEAGEILSNPIRNQLSHATGNAAARSASPNLNAEATWDDDRQAAVAGVVSGYWTLAAPV